MTTDEVELFGWSVRSQLCRYFHMSDYFNYIFNARNCSSKILGFIFT